MNSQALFQLLCDERVQFQAHRKPLPKQALNTVQWLGVGFLLSGNHFAAPLSEVSEIVNTPRLTRVPGVPAWLRGVMNLRGRLVPVYDLQAFLESDRAVSGFGNKFQVLVVSHGTFVSGVLVNRLIGLLRFSEQDGRERPQDEDALLCPYIEGYYERKAALWRIFSIKQFVEERARMQIGAYLNG